MKAKKKHWYDYLWIWSVVYFTLGFFNILFAWLGMIDFLLPVMFAAFGGNKFFLQPSLWQGTNYTVSWATISNIPETGPRQNGCSLNGSDTVF